MTTLPDGTTVNQQFSEPWDVSPISGVSSIYTEAWESRLLQMGTFDLSVDKTSLEVGDTVTFTGTAKRSDGLAAQADVAVSRPDGTTDRFAADVATDGSYEATYTAEVGGKHSAQGVNSVAGLVTTETWEES